MPIELQTILTLLGLLFICLGLHIRAVNKQDFLALATGATIPDDYFEPLAIPEQFENVETYQFSEQLPLELKLIENNRLREIELVEEEEVRQEKLKSIPHNISCQCNTCCEDRILWGIERANRNRWRDQDDVKRHIPVRKRFAKPQVVVVQKQIRHVSHKQYHMPDLELVKRSFARYYDADFD